MVEGVLRSWVDVGAGGAGGQPLGSGYWREEAWLGVFLERMDLDKIVCMYEICNNESQFNFQAADSQFGDPLD